ncbi:MAG: serine hydroxymethyltransferase [Bdellovibrionales bacterium]|nr:serine hydroxymethyltransferase [Bdellovibrionales bacterium]
MVSRLSVREFDPEIAELLVRETERQEFGLEMIPSENFVSEAVLEANGSVLTNKYAEGLPGSRYYGGCEVVDEVERLAIERLKQLFGAEAVNVQLHSGATANQAVFEASILPGDTIMGMKLDHGGHLTHGLKVNFSGKHYNVVAYGVREDTHLIDHDELLELAKQHRPKLIIAGASAYSRAIDFAFFRKVADEVGAVLLCDIAHYAGLVVAGEYPNPVGHSDFVTTTTHKTLRGPRSGVAMCKEKFIKALNRAVFPGLQGGPHMHTIAAKAVAFREALQPEFKEYAKQIVRNARALSSALQAEGFEIVSGGTDSHLLVIDVRPADITGKEAAECLEGVGITANMNTIPYDPQPPRVCSGVRLGTPALTTRGMGESEMVRIAKFISSAVQVRNDVTKQKKLREDIREFSRAFPLYSHRLVSGEG